MSVRNRVEAFTMITFDVATFTGAYQLITAASGIAESCILVKYINDSNRDVTISYDNVNDHDLVRDTTEILYDFQTNAQPSNWYSQLARGTKVYIRGTAGGAGTFYMIGYFNPQM